MEAERGNGAESEPLPSETGQIAQREGTSLERRHAERGNLLADFDHTLDLLGRDMAGML